MTPNPYRADIGARVVNSQIDEGAKELRKKRTPTKTIIKKNAALESHKEDARCSKAFYTLKAVRAHVKKEHRALDTERISGGVQVKL